MFREQIIQPWRDFSSKTVRTKARTLITLPSVSQVIHSSQCFIKISLHEQTRRGYHDGSRGLVLCLLHTQTQDDPVMFPLPHRQTPTDQTMLPATIISKLVYVLHQSIAQLLIYHAEEPSDSNSRCLEVLQVPFQEAPGPFPDS